MRNVAGEPGAQRSRFPQQRQYLDTAGTQPFAYRAEAANTRVPGRRLAEPPDQPGR